MPLVAVTENEDRVLAPDVQPKTWDEWRADSRRRPRMFCRFCQHPMHPKTLQSGTRFFAHNPGSECPFAPGSGESEEHLRTKTRVYLAVERTSWAGELEAHGVDPVSGDEYIIDVLATPPNPTRSPWAYEVQLSNQSDAKTQRRTELCQRGHNAQVTWLLLERRAWFLDFPCVLLSRVDHWTVVDGIFREANQLENPTPMDELIARYHRGKYFWIKGMGYLDQRAAVLGSTPDWASRRNRTRVVDQCERPDMGEIVEKVVAGANTDAAFWTDDEWFLHARMAHARRQTGADLSWVDHEALARHPVSPGLFSKLPSEYLDTN